MENVNLDDISHLVEQARDAVIHAQMNFNSAEYQRAFKALTLAKEQVKLAMHQEVDEDQKVMVHHASEHLTHLSETLVALQSTN
ncbi:hypothetical protein [Metabacillus idriensis]|uniref:hypothetical protein n=1 Tax=Metabacillus idriensis TaxID=324768 RepID=UPI00174D09DA|nr:hypothetical protein [Metabacillus idriensis]